MTRINRDYKMQSLPKNRPANKIILYSLHLCANTQGGSALLIALRKGTDQPVIVIGRYLSLIKVSVRSDNL